MPRLPVCPSDPALPEATLPDAPFATGGITPAVPDKPGAAQDVAALALRPGITCVGLGPGDPQLLTLRAAQWVQAARQVAYFRKAGSAGQARRIVQGMLRSDACEYPMEYPLTTELPRDSAAYARAMQDFYAHWCQRLLALAQRRHVVVLCEGEPFLYGSFIHLYVRLRAQPPVRSGQLPLQVVPGVPAMVGCWHATQLPVTQGDDVLCVLPATLPEDDLLRHMRHAQALVIMKVGRNLPRVRRALHRAGRLDSAWLVQHASTARQGVQRLRDVPDDACPYFSIVLVHGAQAVRALGPSDVSDVSDAAHSRANGQT